MLPENAAQTTDPAEFWVSSESCVGRSPLRRSFYTLWLLSQSRTALLRTFLAPNRGSRRGMAGFVEVILTEARCPVNPPFHGICRISVDHRQLFSDCAKCSHSARKNHRGRGWELHGSKQGRDRLAGKPREIARELNPVTPITASSDLRHSPSPTGNPARAGFLLFHAGSSE